MRRAAPLLALAAVLAGCGGGSRATLTTVEHYANFPPDTIVVTPSGPLSAACRHDANALARESRTFLAAHHGAFSIVDATYFVMRETTADFDARRCDPKLLGSALGRAFPPAKRRELLGDLPRAMAAAIRRALSSAGF